MKNLAVRTIAGFLFLMAVLALALFLSAGTLAYWQAYIYLADFALCTILITIYLARHDRELLEGRVQAGPVAETRRFQQIIQSLASLFFIGLFIMPGLDYRFSWSQVPPVVCLIGDGGFGMLMGEMLTLVKYKLPVKVIVIKNNVLGQIKWEQMVFEGNPQFGVELQPLDFAMYARACGAANWLT